MVRRRTTAKRRGAATIETVLTAAISVPPAVFLLYLGIRWCIFIYQAMAQLVGAPYL